MKKLLLFVFLFAGISGFAQKGNISEVTFYGVDYSYVKVYGASETASQFKNVFNEINKLFISEPKKYDIKKYLKVSVNDIDLEPVNERNADIDEDELITTGGYNIVNSEMIDDIIDELDIEDEEGIGLIFIAELLDKPNNSGQYKIVFFDKDTRDVLEIKSGKGKAKGFGLRNYWAGSIYDMLKKYR